MKNNLIKILLTMSFLLLTITASVIGFFEREKIDALENGFKILGSNNITLEYGNNYIEEGYAAELDGKDYKNEVKVTNNIDNNKIGEYDIEYTLKYKKYNKTIKRKVKIVDNEAPKITLNDKEIYCTIKEKCDDITYTAIDNYDGDITTKVKVDSNVDINTKGNYEIKYSVEDSSGNKTEEIAKVHVTTKDENTFIEVKISTQKLVYYVKKKPVLTTDVTTGLNGATKLGNFRVNKKAKNTYLVTKKYRTFVKYWIGYDGRRYGIHDASWRKKFGGKIYLTNGSHGCVNVPTSSAEKLYSMVEVGTPVYIKR